ncbi:four helix bundle protein [Ulvibacterium sp.]|uniref:four helix bundle protein n=1 Tax=Ulvibacterium sp. TaxID=2665914 RepID=UPI003CC6C5E8
MCQLFPKRFHHFLQISLGSLFELETHIILCRDLQFVGEKESTQIIKKVQTLQKRVASLIKYNKT